MVVAEATSTGNFSWPLSLSLTQDWCQIGRELELRDVRMLAILISYHKCNRCRWVGSGFKHGLPEHGTSFAIVTVQRE